MAGRGGSSADEVQNEGVKQRQGHREGDRRANRQTDKQTEQQTNQSDYGSVRVGFSI